MSHDHNHDHSHSHQHQCGGGHGHSHAPASFNRAFAIAVIFNFAFVLIQGGYAITAHSMSLLADAGHNLGDVLGLLMAWFASWLLSKPSKGRFSYGYRRTTILAAMVNALILVGTSVVIANESIHKLIYPVHVNEIIVMIVAALGIFINGGTALLFMRGRKDDLNIKGAFLHLAFDALISLGVVVGAVVIYFTGWMWLDPVIGLGIVVMILFGTWGLLRDSTRLLLDAAPAHIDHQAVRDYLLAIEGVEATHDLHIWGLSTKEAALTVHLVMPGGNLSDEARLQILSDLKGHYKIEHVTIQVEEGSKDHPCHLDDDDCGH